jgi:hypothetical protein
MALVIPTPDPGTAAMAVAMPLGFTALATSNTAAIGAQTAATVAALTGQTVQQAGSSTTSLMTRIAQFIERIAKFIATMAKVFRIISLIFPIVKLVMIIIIVCSNGLLYIILLIVYLFVSVIEVLWQIVTHTGFIYFFWTIFFVITEGVFMFAYVAFWLALATLLFVFCIFVALVDMMGKGWLRDAVLCQNTPSSWYKVPNYHYGNKYSRGLFCSRPCPKGYYPDDTGLSCVRQPFNTPSFCPNAQVMRFYSGVGKGDTHYKFNKFNTKINLKYLVKSPAEREKMIFQHYLNKREYLDNCTKTANGNIPLKEFDPMLRSVCANVKNMSSSKIKSYDSELIDKMTETCKEAYCDANNSYPFCSKLSNVSGVNASQLLRKIILTIISIIVFVLVIVLFIKNLKE